MNIDQWKKKTMKSFNDIIKNMLTMPTYLGKDQNEEDDDEEDDQ